MLICLSFWKFLQRCQLFMIDFENEERKRETKENIHDPNNIHNWLRLSGWYWFWYCIWSYVVNWKLAINRVENLWRNAFAHTIFIAWAIKHKLIVCGITSTSLNFSKKNSTQIHSEICRGKQKEWKHQWFI